MKELMKKLMNKLMKICKKILREWDDDIEYVERKINDIYSFLQTQENMQNSNENSLCEKLGNNNQIYLKARLEKYIESTYYSEMLKLLIGAFAIINVMHTLISKSAYQSEIYLRILIVLLIILIFIMIYTIYSYSLTNKNKGKARYILSVMDSINQNNHIKPKRKGTGE